jgi:hypothetical protein
MGRKAERKREGKAGSSARPGERQPTSSAPSTHPFARKTSAMKADEDAAAHAATSIMK